MKFKPCSMALLIEAKRDGRLGDRELGSVDRHLASCASCAELASDLTKIRALLRAPIQTPAPLVVQRGRLEVLRAAARPPSPMLPRRRSVMALALVLATAGALGLALHQRAEESRAGVAQTLAVNANAPLRTATTVTPESQARFTRAEADGVETVTLSEGAVSFSVRHLQAGERFLVKTADAEVEVRGTLFRVEAAGDRIQNVSVLEGKVEVRFRGAAFFVTAAERWNRPADAPPAPQAIASNEASAAPAEAAQSTPVTAKLSLTKQRSGSSTEFTASVPTKSASVVGERLGAGAFEEGMGMMERGDYGVAAQHLDAFSRSNPGDDRSEDAAFLVILALQRAGRSADAAAAARRHLATYPSGYRRAQVEAIAEAP